MARAPPSILYAIRPIPIALDISSLGQDRRATLRKALSYFIVGNGRPRIIEGPLRLRTKPDVMHV